MTTSAAFALAAVGVAAPASAAEAGAPSAPPGRVCMFLAPDHIFGLGHVGWAFREADGVGWDFGSTRGESSSWRRSGMFGDVVAGFRAASDSSGPYRSYRCRSTTGSDPARAHARADVVDTRPYDFLTDNCLTRSLEVFHAYDATGELASLGAGRITAPRWYFLNDLDGFEGAVAL